MSLVFDLITRGGREEGRGNLHRNRNCWLGGLRGCNYRVRKIEGAHETNDRIEEEGPQRPGRQSKYACVYVVCNKRCSEIIHEVSSKMRACASPTLPSFHLQFDDYDRLKKAYLQASMMRCYSHLPFIELQIASERPKMCHHPRKGGR